MSMRQSLWFSANFHYLFKILDDSPIWVNWSAVRSFFDYIAKASDRLDKSDHQYTYTGGASINHVDNWGGLS